MLSETHPSNLSKDFIRREFTALDFYCTGYLFCFVFPAALKLSLPYFLCVLYIFSSCEWVFCGQYWGNSVSTFSVTNVFLTWEILGVFHVDFHARN